jgi:hypothetical protein
MFDTESDYAIITVTDRRGRTICKIIKEKPDSNWIISDFQTSRKAQRHKPYPRDLKPHLLKKLPDGRWRLDMAGPPLFWEQVKAAADGFVAAGYTRTKLTVDELHTATAYIK